MDISETRTWDRHEDFDKHVGPSLAVRNRELATLAQEVYYDVNPMEKANRGPVRSSDVEWQTHFNNLRNLDIVLQLASCGSDGDGALARLKTYLARTEMILKAPHVTMGFGWNPELRETEDWVFGDPRLRCVIEFESEPQAQAQPQPEPQSPSPVNEMEDVEEENVEEYHRETPSDGSLYSPSGSGSES